MSGTEGIIIALVIMVIPLAISIPLTIGLVGNKKKGKSDETTDKL